MWIILAAQLSSWAVSNEMLMASLTDKVEDEKNAHTIWFINMFMWKMRLVWEL